MSDPFDRLRSPDGESSVPDIGTIKARARRIERRRQVGLASAATIIVVAIVGIMVTTGPFRDTTRQLAQEAHGSAEPRAAKSAPDSEAAAAKGQRLAEAERRSGAASTTGGGAARSQGGTSAAGSAPYSAADSAESGPLEATIEVNDQSLGPRRGAGLTLKVCNRTSATVERTFNSGQRYDFDVSRDGSLVWRWSEGRAFISSIGEERWGPGQCKTWTEWWDGMDRSGRPATSGTYEAVGVLTSSSPQRTVPSRFCLDIC